MQNKKYKWYKIAESKLEITRRGERDRIEVNVAGKEICIMHYQETLHACSAKCPHAGGPIGQGFIDRNGNIACPLHGYRFNIKNGTNSSGEGYHLKLYPIRENEDGVFVGIEIAAI